MDLVNKAKQEDNLLQSASSYIDTLPFELVDIGFDYGDFKGQVNIWDVGSKQNFKISSLLAYVLNVIKKCKESTQDRSTSQLNRSHIFKLCLKRLLKKLCKLYATKNNNL